jgi:hypothetical protein
MKRATTQFADVRIKNPGFGFIGHLDDGFVFGVG